MTDKTYKRYAFNLCGGPLDGIHHADESGSGLVHGIPADKLSEDLTEEQAFALIRRYSSFTRYSISLYNNHRFSEINDVINLDGHQYLVVNKNTVESPHEEITSTIIFKCTYRK